MAELPFDIPPAFAQRIRAVFGPDGDAWLRELPDRLRSYAARWELSLQPPFPLSYNYVAPATRADGQEVVLKLGVPNHELRSEIEALRIYGGRGMVALLEWVPDEYGFLLERLRPGETLLSVDDEAATRVAAEVMRGFWTPAPPDGPFRHVSDWAAGLGRMRARFGGGTGPLPPGLVDRAEGLFRELLASMGPPLLLHGDLHHENILSATRAPWLALDPKGVIGEAEYEVGALMRNPLPRLSAMSDARPLLARRLDVLSERLGFDRRRLRDWSFAQAVLSAWWSVEDNQDGWVPMIACAELLADL